MKSNCLPYCLLMFEREIILEEQLAARCLFQCSVDRKLPARKSKKTLLKKVA